MRRGGGSFPLSSSETKEGIQEGGLSLSRCTGLGKKPFPGLVNFVAAVAYHFCLACSIHTTWGPPFSRALQTGFFLVADVARKYFPVQQACEGPKMAKILLWDQRMKGNRVSRRREGRREGKWPLSSPRRSQCSAMIDGLAEKNSSILSGKSF